MISLASPHPAHAHFEFNCRSNFSRSTRSRLHLLRREGKVYRRYIDGKGRGENKKKKGTGGTATKIKWNSDKSREERVEREDDGVKVVRRGR